MTVLVPNSCNCTALRRGTRHVTRFYDEALAPVGLGVNQYAILARLERLGASSIQALAQDLVMDRSTLGHLLRPLERRALIGLARSETDRRIRVLVLTPEGTALLVAAQPLWASAQDCFETTFGNESAVQLRSLLERVVSARLGRPAANTHGKELPDA